MTKEALDFCVSKCIDGGVIAEICKATDEFIIEQSKSVYAKLQYKGTLFLPSFFSYSQVSDSLL